MQASLEVSFEVEDDADQKSHISRRDALKSVAIAGLGLMGAGALSACSPKAEEVDAKGGGVGGPSFDKEVDIIVVGTGTVIGGILAASELGNKKILVAEKDPEVFCGTTAISGDGHLMATRIGAQLAFMDATWGNPYFVTSKDYKPGEFLYDPSGSDAFAPRGFPHTLMVNHKGRRFHDESTMYDVANRAFLFFDTGTEEYVNIPGYWIADSQCTDTFLFPTTKEPGTIPDFVFQFNSLEELADGMGIDKEAMLNEIENFNKNAAQGIDPVWHRGKQNSLNTLAMMGGTRGGLRINANAQVVDVYGEPITGLYAAGNCSSGVGTYYWIGGATLSSGTVFSYRAAKHICGLL